MTAKSNRDFDFVQISASDTSVIPTAAKMDTVESITEVERHGTQFVLCPLS